MFGDRCLDEQIVTMWNWYKPDPCMLIWLGFFNILLVYNLSIVWFHSEKEFRKNLEKMNNMPSWVPFRDRFIQDSNDKETWSRQTKLTSVIGILFLILMDTLVILAMKFGE